MNGARATCWSGLRIQMFSRATVYRYFSRFAMRRWSLLLFHERMTARGGQSVRLWFTCSQKLPRLPICTQIQWLVPARNKLWTPLGILRYLSTPKLLYFLLPDGEWIVNVGRKRWSMHTPSVSFSFCRSVNTYSIPFTCTSPTNFCPKLQPITNWSFHSSVFLSFAGSLLVHRWPTHPEYRLVWSEAAPFIAVILPKIIAVALFHSIQKVSESFVIAANWFWTNNSTRERTKEVNSSFCFAYEDFHWKHDTEHDLTTRSIRNDFWTAARKSITSSSRDGQFALSWIWQLADDFDMIHLSLCFVVSCDACCYQTTSITNSQHAHIVYNSVVVKRDVWDNFVFSKSSISFRCGAFYVSVSAEVKTCNFFLSILERQSPPLSSRTRTIEQKCIWFNVIALLINP